MVPEFDERGKLPPGIHESGWEEFAGRFGCNQHRKKLLGGLYAALVNLKSAGCTTVYIDGSFVTTKELPGDFDACWDIDGVNPNLLDPVLLTFDLGRATQKAKFFGELFPAQFPAEPSGKTYLEFFQFDPDTDAPKGIVKIDLRKFP